MHGHWIGSELGRHRNRVVTPARTPPELPGLRPQWSTVLEIADQDGRPIGVHVLDVGPRDADLTVVCVHGNPTWSYLWRGVVASAPADVRVIAIDQVGMGYSARSEYSRRLADRIDDAEAIIRAADVRGRVLLMAHDWGGPIALGLAERLVEERVQSGAVGLAGASVVGASLVGIVLTNTAVHQPEHRRSPALIAAARLPGILSMVTHRTPGFVAATTAISSMDRPSARALRAPYTRAADRQAIYDFVADIPLQPDHPSLVTLNDVAEGLSSLADVPTLLVWGMRDPVFSPRYLDDLRRRMPHAQVQQYADAGHLVLEDRPDAIEEIWRWIQDLGQGSSPQHQVFRRGAADPLTSADLLTRLRNLESSHVIAVTERAAKRTHAGSWRSIPWTLLDARVRSLASGLSERGVQPGDRVALLIPPGADLLAVVYAVWSIGATIVVIDAANGPRALWRSLRGARIDHVVAIRRARPIVAALRVRGALVWVDELPTVAQSDSRSQPSIEESRHSADTDAAIVFTSGATGPAKPVAYTRERIAATRDVLLDHYGFTPDDVLVAAFAPWAVLGPLLGIASVIPAMDASRPGSLTASALADAMEQAGGTVMWMSPAALRSVLAGATGDTRKRLMAASSNLRYLLLAGAPVSRRLLREAMELWPHTDVRTPYGMTEVLPATDVRAEEVLATDAQLGVLVGRPLPGVQVAIAPVDGNGIPSQDLTERCDVLGEVVVKAGHAKTRYDGRAFVERQASRNPGWHRTGDVGVLDDEQRLWIQGRLAHVITTDRGPVGPVPIEQRAEAALVDAGRTDVLVAAVGVGPVGCQVPVVVCAPALARRKAVTLYLAEPALTDVIRAAIPEVAAVLWRSRMPVDIRHGAKIDRQALAGEAGEVLAGRR